MSLFKKIHKSADVIYEWSLTEFPLPYFLSQHFIVQFCDWPPWNENKKICFRNQLTFNTDIMSLFKKIKKSADVLYGWSLTEFPLPYFLSQHFIVQFCDWPPWNLDSNNRIAIFWSFWCVMASLFHAELYAD